MLIKLNSHLNHSIYISLRLTIKNYDKFILILKNIMRNLNLKDSCDILLANYSNQIKYKNIEYLLSTVISHKNYILNLFTLFFNYHLNYSIFKS